MQPDMGCGGWRHCPRVDIRIFFFLVVSEYAPIIANSGQSTLIRIGLYWPAETGFESHRNSSKYYKYINKMCKTHCLNLNIFKPKKKKTPKISHSLLIATLPLCSLPPSLYSNFRTSWNVLVSNLWVVLNLWSCFSYYLLLLLNLVYVYIMWKSMLSNI